MFLINPRTTWWYQRKLPELTPREEVHLHLICNQPKCFLHLSAQEDFIQAPRSTDSTIGKVTGQSLYSPVSSRPVRAMLSAVAAAQCPWLCAAPKGSICCRAQTPTWTHTHTLTHTWQMVQTYICDVYMWFFSWKAFRAPAENAFTAETISRLIDWQFFWLRLNTYKICTNKIISWFLYFSVAFLLRFVVFDISL